MPPDDSRTLALTGAFSLAVASVVAALALWGPLGVPICFLILATLVVVAFRLAKRTERIYGERTDHSEFPVFAALLNGVRGGDLTISSDGFSFQDGRRQAKAQASDWNDVTALVLTRKGPFGSAGILRIDLLRTSPLTFEIADCKRIRDVLANTSALSGKANFFRNGPE